MFQAKWTFAINEGFPPKQPLWNLNQFLHQLPLAPFYFLRLINGWKCETNKRMQDLNPGLGKSKKFKTNEFMRLKSLFKTAKRRRLCVWRRPLVWKAVSCLSSCGRERGTKGHCVLVKKQTFYVMKCNKSISLRCVNQPKHTFRWTGRSDTSKSSRTPQNSFSLPRARASETQKPVHAQRCPQCHRGVSVHVKGSPFWLQRSVRSVVAAGLCTLTVGWASCRSPLNGPAGLAPQALVASC